MPFVASKCESLRVQIINAVVTLDVCKIVRLLEQGANPLARNRQGRSTIAILNGIALDVQAGVSADTLSFAEIETKVLRIRQLLTSAI